jgi:O-antigen/teichoic acid export membrane protein
VRLGFLVGVVLLTVIPEATLVLLNELWLPIVPVFRLMTVYVVLAPLYRNLSYLVTGVGRPEVLVRVRLGQVVLFVIAVVALAQVWGIEGIAIAADVTVLAGVTALWVYAARHIRLDPARVLGWPLCALLAASAAGVVLSTVVAWPSLWLALILKAFGVSSAYVLVLLVAEGHTLLKHGAWLWRVVREPHERTRISNGNSELSVADKV